MEVFCRGLMFHRPTETLASAADCPQHSRGSVVLGRLPILPCHNLTPPWDQCDLLSVPRSHQVQDMGPLAPELHSHHRQLNRGAVSRRGQ